MENQIVVNDYRQMDKILKEERTYLLNMVKRIKKAKCNVLFIQKSILRDAVNDLSLHFLAKLNILVVTNIERDEVEFICKVGRSLIDGEDMPGRGADFLYFPPLAEHGLQTDRRHRIVRRRQAWVGRPGRRSPSVGCTDRQGDRGQGCGPHGLDRVSRRQRVGAG